MKRPKSELIRVTNEIKKEPNEVYIYIYMALALIGRMELRHSIKIWSVVFWHFHKNLTATLDFSNITSGQMKLNPNDTIFMTCINSK